MALSLLDRHYLDRAAQGWSPAEIAQDTGTEPDRVYARITALLKERTIWSEIQQRQLLLHSVFSLKGRLEEWLDSDNFDKDRVNTYLSTLRLISEALEKNAKTTEGQVAAIVTAHKQYMLGMIHKLSIAAVDELHNRHPEITMSEIDGIFTEVISLERHAADA
jgi:hypothetical protein